MKLFDENYTAPDVEADYISERSGNCKNCTSMTHPMRGLGNVKIKVKYMQGTDCQVSNVEFYIFDVLLKLSQGSNV